MKVNIYIGDTKFEDLSLEEQNEVGQKIAAVFAEIKFNKLFQLIEDNDPRAKEYYEQLVDCIVKN
ncbi:hypothetical protein [Clostridium formicaceticum]|uniref:Uncharacterized protein n=1 Tax=Clostridium formicaceticum TaxID=1497 RepID=A0AAC9RHT0_9CLOT|nr:hypothetical protein [Clostridium formicaceticum]AOY76785.1 hypothetical protein BJL90_13535 [Clostridium formicaceticum]ARE87244.1 hypothetical protein CLFO_16430 [Clostridium formicaceticum]